MILSIVIPCLNEQHTIKQAVHNAYQAARRAKLTSFEIIVADNGSNDGTQDLVKKQKLARLISVPTKGYGITVHTGILNAKGDYVLYADADLSYDFSQLPKYLVFLPQSPDLVLGSRLAGKMASGAMPFLHRYFGTPLLTFLISHLFGLHTTDSNSGMRLLKKSFYLTLDMQCPGFAWSSEQLIKTALHHGKFIEIPIDFYPDGRTHGPYLSPWKDGLRNLRIIFQLFLAKQSGYNHPKSWPL